MPGSMSPGELVEFAARNTKVPSLLQGIAARTACGYGCHRSSTRTGSKRSTTTGAPAAATTTTKAGPDDAQAHDPGGAARLP